MTSSSDVSRRVIRGDHAAAASTLVKPELRAGAWTRFGEAAILGDQVTEQVLSGIAESTANAARAQGYAVGWAEGRRDAVARAAVEEAEATAARAAVEARREAEHAAALAALQTAAASFQQVVSAIGSQVEDEALRLARELTAVLVGHELATAADPAGDVVRRAVAVLPTGVPATLRVHPSVRSSAAVEGLAQHGVSVVADPSLAPHDAVVETAEAVVDLGIRSALARVTEVLA